MTAPPLPSPSTALPAPAPASPRRRRLGPRASRVLLITHAILGAAWLGSTMAGVFVLTVVMDEETVVGAAAAVRLLDLLLYIPLDIATLVTGLVFSIWTHWGFLKHGWVAVKYVINLTIFISAGVVNAPAMVTLDTLAREHGVAAWHLPEFQAARWTFLVTTAFYCVILAVAVVLPLVKPSIPLPYQGRVHRLRVVSVTPETRDAATVAFRVPFPLRRRFRYAAGQYVTLHVTIDGVDHHRSYSLSSAPGDPQPAISIKRVPGGLVSNHLLDTLHPGARVRVEQPRGRFGRSVDSDTPGCYVLIGAGSGIAPLVSIAYAVAAGPAESVVHVIDGNRTPDDVIKRADLDLLAARHGVQVTHVFSRLAADDDTPGRRGHIDQALLAAYLVEHRLPPQTQFYVCGPDAMIDDTVAALAALGVEDERIHREYFAATAPPTAPEQVTLTAYLDGEEITLPTTTGVAVTDALERAGYQPPTTCRTGTCSTCVARICDGAAVMRANHALGPADLADGLTLTCQAVPTSRTLVVDYDAAR